MDRKGFGETLRNLRKQYGFTQDVLAQKLPVSSESISNWERAYENRGRIWKPDRNSALRLLEIFSEALTLEQAKHWFSQLDYHLEATDIEQFFPGMSTEATTKGPDFSLSQADSPKANWLRLNLLQDEQLFGIDRLKGEIELKLKVEEAPWIVSLNGIGGIGKTTLATNTVQILMAGNRFYDLGWVNAKQAGFLPDQGRIATYEATLTSEQMVDSLLRQLEPNTSLARPPAEKRIQLTDLLKKHPYLVVIDNLESMEDQNALLPVLRQFMNPTKFLITSRNNLQTHSDTFSFPLDGLGKEDTIAFLRYEADSRNHQTLKTASLEQLTRIYDIVGGNPLALKLIIGQMTFLPFDLVLNNLKEARGQEVEQLYNYIYWEAWKNLDQAGQQVLLLMPLSHGSTWTQMLEISEMDQSIFLPALRQLVSLSLVQVRGTLEEPRYYIHRLTETFLLQEVLKWQSPE